MGPVVSAKQYVLTFAALLALTLSTVLIGFLDLGWGSMFVAVAIALAKATLIACFFMHALLERKLVKLVIAGAILWFLILVTLTVGDYLTRGWLGFGGK
ncbi:MAG TPA: cytochrome C oxidase subunit IV family protein [Bryobacteraceae bacterium]|nr:cytochrome C oxidase subunit IV family protein [Bryobacteraceae bacterium]